MGPDVSILLYRSPVRGKDRAIWRVSPPPTPPHNVADLRESVASKPFAATLRGGGTSRLVNGYLFSYTRQRTRWLPSKLAFTGRGSRHSEPASLLLSYASRKGPHFACLDGEPDGWLDTGVVRTHTPSGLRSVDLIDEVRAEITVCKSHVILREPWRPKNLS